MKSNLLKIEHNTGRSWVEDLCRLRVETYLYWVCLKAGIKPRGNQMEVYFESYKAVRTCKYDRYFVDTTPGPDTVKHIENKVEGSAKVFYSPIWQALHILSFKKNEVQELFLSLPMGLQIIVFENERNSFNQLVRSEIGLREINKISEFGGIPALACLITLRAENDKTLLNIPIRKVENAIYRLLMNCCTCNEFPKTQWKVFCFIKQQLQKINSKLADCWHISEAQFHNALLLREYCLALALRVKLIRYQEIVNPFLYWLNRGDIRLIMEEMQQVQLRSRALKIKEYHGLNWLISKINHCYPRSEKLNYYVKS